MSEPQDPDKSAPDPVGASRFWEHYGSARPDRSSGAGSNGHAKGHGNGNRAASDPNASAKGSGTGSGDSHVRGDRRGTHTDGHECLEWCPLCRGAELLRATVPPELQEQWQALARDSTALLKALVEAHLAREQGKPESRESGGDGPIEDIPID